MRKISLNGLFLLKKVQFLSKYYELRKILYLTCIIHTVVKGVITLLEVKELKPILRESYNHTIGF